jgi:hypothetical protein
MDEEASPAVATKGEKKTINNTKKGAVLQQHIHG